MSMVALTLEDAGVSAWTRTTLGEVCQINPGKPKPDALPADAPVTFVPMAAVDDVTGAIVAPENREFAKVRGSYTAFRDGDVLFAKITPCMENGKAAVARGLVNGLGFGSSEFHVLRPSGKVLPEFIYQLIRQKSFRAEARDNMTGSVGQARVPTEWLKNFEFELPPIETQREIVGLVSELQKQIESTSDRLATIPALLKKFRQSVLAAACSGQLTADWREGHTTVEPVERLLARIRQHRKSKPISSPPAMDEDVPRDWVLTTVGQICAVATGATPLRTKSAYFGGDIPWITSSAVNEGTVTRASQFITELAVKETNAKVFPPGTLIVAMYGEGQTRGRVAELGIATATNQALAALLFDDVNENCRAFVKLHFLKNYEEMRNLAAGGVQPNLSLGLIRDSELLLPPLDEQAEIVRRVESLFALADSIESRLAEATNQVERTTQAILAKAFRGELIE